MNPSQSVKDDPGPYNHIVGPVGFEPTTRGLKVQRWYDSTTLKRPNQAYLSVNLAAVT
jgi:hypothetical protein